MAQGRLPHLQRLVQRGASGELHSMVPILSPLLWTTLATVQARAGRPQQARQVLEEATPVQRGDIRLLNTLALVYRDLGQTEKAADALRQSLATRPDQPKVSELLQELQELP